MLRLVRLQGTKQSWLSSLGSLRECRPSPPLQLLQMRSLTSNDNGDPASNNIPGYSHLYGSLQDQNTSFTSKQQETPKAWQALNNSQVQDVTVKALIYDLVHQQTATLEKTVPWFLANMPASYFDQVPETFRKDHIKAISAIRDANLDLYLNLQSTHLSDGRQVLTFIRPGTQPGTLLQMVQELPKNVETPLSRLHVFSTADGTMSLNMFIYGNTPTHHTIDTVQSLGKPILEFADKVQRGECKSLSPSPLFTNDHLISHMMQCTATYLHIGCEDPVRFLRHVTLVDQVSGTDGTAVHMTNNGDGTYWIDTAIGNSVPQVALENLCRLLFVHHFDVTRSRLDIFSSGSDDSVTLLRALVAPVTPTNEASMQLLSDELKRAKWLDPATNDLVFDRFPALGMTRAEIITGLLAVSHASLAKIHPTAFSSTSLYDKACRYIQEATEIADLFLDRFRPGNPVSEEDFQSRAEQLSARINADVEDSTATTILQKMLEIVKLTLKTNLYMPERYALSFRLDPKCMETEGIERELPYGILFVHGRRFNGFHVRFRDIARGGMRLVTPSTAEQHALESARQYDECYGLAFAQQLKNKDIPEGGSKAVTLIDTHGLSPSQKQFVMRKSVKAMTDAVLDLIVDTEYTRKYLVDYWKKKEVLYLGPDEQVTPYDIEWIVARAKERGYGTPAAFMSSKPKAGINHKEFGVTSEGVNVYLDVALRKVLKIDPTKESFTVKMTGGPDGDVAGNELKILFREYGENVKVVGIADHSGCAEDPDGLDQTELMRLFNESLSIANFDATKLGESGCLHTVDSIEGLKARNSMHNRLEADAFIPCGGRPNTIDMSNYKQFLKKDGSPSSGLIVEGANLFVTAEARKALFKEAGVVIVKDSSANKGGVITSSYEICAAMLLSEDEFFDNKDKIVSEVLGKLRELAKLEAVLLFREFDNYYDGLSLPEVSQIISNSINKTTDALAAALDSLSEDEQTSLLPLFRNHLPATMAELAFDRLNERVPAQYIKNAIASCLTSKLVYKEGTKFIETLPEKKLAAIALKYIQKENEVAKLMEAIKDSDIADADKATVSRILEEGGARTALKFV